MLRRQRDATVGGTPAASEGSCGSAAPEGGVPHCGFMEARFFASEGSPSLRRGFATLQQECCPGGESPD